MHRPSVCATGLPSPPRALGLGAALRWQAPLAPPSAALRSSHTPARPQWLYGAMWLLLRPSPRAYLVVGLSNSIGLGPPPGADCDHVWLPGVQAVQTGGLHVTLPKPWSVSQALFCQSLAPTTL